MLTPCSCNNELKKYLLGAFAAIFAGSSLIPISVRKAFIVQVKNVEAASCDIEGQVDNAVAMTLRGKEE